jgi:hypothetical protein
MLLLICGRHVLHIVLVGDLVISFLEVDFALMLLLIRSRHAVHIVVVNEPIVFFLEVDFVLSDLWVTMLWICYGQHRFHAIVVSGVYILI